MIAVVPLSELWVDADFKGSQLRRMKIGQPAKMTADLYDSKVVYHGKVMGLLADTGNAFSSLSAQNATGNWIRVVQHVPVRISLDAKKLQQNPLRVGLSMTVKVDTTEKDSGKTMTAEAEQNTALPETESVDWKAANALVDKIFKQYAE